MVSRKGRLVTKPITIETKNTGPSFCDIKTSPSCFLLAPSPSRSVLKR